MSQGTLKSKRKYIGNDWYINHYLFVLPLHHICRHDLNSDTMQSYLKYCNSLQTDQLWCFLGSISHFLEQLFFSNYCYGPQLLAAISSVEPLIYPRFFLPLLFEMPVKVLASSLMNVHTWKCETLNTLCTTLDQSR